MESRQGIDKKVLIIQTAFIGDVILATSLVEAVAASYPMLAISMLVRKGNESVLECNPHINKVLVWDKSRKFAELGRLIKEVRDAKYEVVICLQRFATMGLLAALAGAKEVVGYEQNPLSWLFGKRIKFETDGRHEVERNLELARLALPKVEMRKPRVYVNALELGNLQPVDSYVVVAPASVWATKTLPLGQWEALVKNLDSRLKVCYIGGKGDFELIEKLRLATGRGENLAEKLSLRQSGRLIAGAVMTYSNDSAPMHLASATDSPVCAFFCSTVPKFGFGPLASESYIVQETIGLTCRPCGLHGQRKCGEGHFLCGKLPEMQLAASYANTKLATLLES